MLAACCPNCAGRARDRQAIHPPRPRDQSGGAVERELHRVDRFTFNVKMSRSMTSSRRQGLFEKSRSRIVITPTSRPTNRRPAAACDERSLHEFAKFFSGRVERPPGPEDRDWRLHETANGILGVMRFDFPLGGFSDGAAARMHARSTSPRSARCPAPHWRGTHPAPVRQVAGWRAARRFDGLTHDGAPPVPGSCDGWPKKEAASRN